VAQIQWLYREDTGNVVVISPGVDTSRFYPIPDDEAKEFIGLPEEARIVLFVGRIEPLKGVDTLIQAVSRLRRARVLGERPFCLAIIGGDPHVSEEEISIEMERIKRLSRELGLADLVLFLGKRDQDTLQYYYSAAEIVVVPSQYESFGLVALEAMACGTPVVASEIGGLAYLVQDGETGFHVPAGDPVALADRIQAILADDVLRARLGRQAVEYAQAYAWPLVADQILELYASLLEQKLA
jgi:D-inositol-3-phosphate glycosyltransferase